MSSVPGRGGDCRPSNLQGPAAPMRLDVPLGSDRRGQMRVVAATFAQDRAASELSQPQPSEQNQQPNRQHNVNARMDATNVCELVSKAKKAAASLWMILHAQNCRLPEGSCPHRGCSEIKILLVHVRTCPVAGPDLPCPTGRRGCNETRKLLAHYRRCKDARAKRAGPGRSRPRDGQTCLVCSLVARHARGSIDATGGRARGRGGRVALLLSSPEERRSGVERGLADGGLANGALRRTTSMTLMPPPPPRPRPPSSYIETSPGCPSLGSPPDPSQFPQIKIKSSADSSSSVRSHSSEPSPPNRSCKDGHVRVPFPILRNMSRDVAAAGEGPVVPGSAAVGSRRRRSESLDERRTRVRFAPAIVAAGQDLVDGVDCIGRSGSRPRSASCSNVRCHDEGASTVRWCETIAEEP